ncbi:MAG: hypothetical protein OXM61_17190 [Candidatus Poribacteria bacterium]|nr:hypothetical protein [Candidatus Poribacteria bacterium]
MCRLKRRAARTCRGIACRDTEVSEDHSRMWRKTVKGDMVGFDIGFYEKYPDVMIRFILSDAEYQTLSRPQH